MAHWREDARWLKLGIHYAKAAQVAQRLFVHMNWLGFREFGVLFENGQQRMDDLKNARTNRMGAILPRNTDFLRMPELMPRQPTGRLMH